MTEGLEGEGVQVQIEGISTYRTQEQERRSGGCNNGNHGSSESHSVKVVESVFSEAIDIQGDGISKTATFKPYSLNFTVGKEGLRTRYIRVKITMLPNTLGAVYADNISLVVLPGE